MHKKLIMDRVYTAYNFKKYIYWIYHYKLLKCLAQYLYATADWEIRFKRTKPLQLSETDYEKGFVRISKYDVPREPEMEELFKADITTNKLVGFCDAAHANDL